jgi:hypothetical protein
VLIDNVDGTSNPLHVPDETSTKDAMINWVQHIKSAQMPNWIGLPNNAEKVLLAERGNFFILIVQFYIWIILGQELLRKLLKMSDDEFAYEEDDSQQNKKAPSWMVVLTGHCQTWLAALPKVGRNWIYKFYDL